MAFNRKRNNWEDSDDDKTKAFGQRAFEDDTATDAEIAKLNELLERAEPMIEQVNTLYNQYFVSAERRPPIERRRLLDEMMQTIHLMKKPTQSLRFRATALHARYTTHKERWNKKLRMHNAKIRKPV
jgi:hypothetical protein